MSNLLKAISSIAGLITSPLLTAKRLENEVTLIAQNKELLRLVNEQNAAISALEKRIDEQNTAGSNLYFQLAVGLVKAETVAATAPKLKINGPHGLNSYAKALSELNDWAVQLRSRIAIIPSPTTHNPEERKDVR